MNELDHELIARYLSGEMDADTKAAFETRIDAEADLRQAVQSWRDIQETLRQTLQPDPQREQLEKTLHHFRPLMTQQPARVVRFRRTFIAAASVAAAIGILFFWSPWAKPLHEQYVAQEMVSPAERGNAVDTLLERAAHSFNHHHYGKAALVLDTLLAKDPANAYARYYRGVSYLENNQPSLARPDLEIIFKGESIFKYDGAFFIAISYLKEKNKAAARQWLQKIPADADNYDKAQKLLDQM